MKVIISVVLGKRASPSIDCVEIALICLGSVFLQHFFALLAYTCPEIFATTHHVNMNLIGS